MDSSDFWINIFSNHEYFKYDNADGDWCDLGKWFWGIKRSMGLCGPFLDESLCAVWDYMEE